MLRKKVCATLLAMSVLASSVMPVGAAELEMQVGTPKGASATSVIDKAPPTPNISRFWMEGFAAYWYRMETNLQKGDCIYSIDPDPSASQQRNEVIKTQNPDNYTIKEIPDKFIGCDYIVTRKAEKGEKKQKNGGTLSENDAKNQRKKVKFYAEQKIDVYAAIDKKYNNNVPGSLKGFTKTNDTVKTKDGREYFLAKKTFDKGLVEIGRFEGSYEGRNAFYLILPSEGTTVSKALTDNAVVKEGTKPEKNAADEKYQYYLNDVFNLHKGNTPDGYTNKNVSLSGTPSSSEEKNYKSGENIAKNKPYTFNSQGYKGNPVDGDAGTYWESSGFPGYITINLEAACKFNKITLKLKQNWGDRTQKIKIETSDNGRDFKTLVKEKEYKFKKNDKNVLDITFDETTAKYIRVTGSSNSEANGVQLSEVEVYGPSQKVTLVHEDTNKNRHAILKDGAELTKTFDKAITGKIVFEGKVKASSKDKEMSIPVLKSEDGKTAVDLKFGSDGKIKAGNTNVMDYNKDTWYTIKLLVDVDAGTYEVWVNHVREVQNVKFSNNVKNIKSMTFSNNSGELNVDNLRLYDNTEVFIVDDNFNKEATKAIPSGWTYTNEQNISVEEVPFKEDKSMMLDGKGTSATVSFNPISGDATIEAKVKPMEDSWATLPLVKDSKGNVAVKVALYKDNIYACNGNNWEYLCAQEVPNNYYPAENWYQVKVVLNTYTNRYDLYIDGARRCRNLSFATDVEDVASVTYAAEEENTIYVDNVKVFDSASLARGLYPKENVFNVKEFGAKGDGKTDDTNAIASAIQAAEYTGGTVLLENGVFLCGQVDMLNDVSFFVDTSAEFLAKMDRDSYVQFTPSEALNANNQLGRGIFRSQKTENFRIIGGGMINGNGLYAWDENDPRDSRRPCVMYLTQSKDIYLENINIESSPFWTVVPLESENITARNISITNNIAPNRDGIDPTNCSNMTMENCFIIAGDDCICPKSGIDMVSENVEVRNAFMQSYCNGIKFGTDTFYDFRDYSFEDVWMKCIGLTGMTIQAVDGSYIDNIRFKRIDMNDVDNGIAFMVGNRQRTRGGLGNKKRDGYIRNVIVEDMNYTNPSLSPYGLEPGEDVHESLIVGLNPNEDRNVKKGEDTHRVSNVLFKNVYQEMPGGDTKTPGKPRGILSGYPEHKDVVKNEGNDNKQSKGWAYCMRWTDNIKFENCTNVLLKSDVRKEYSFDDHTDKEIAPCTVKSNVEQKTYGIVFEKDGKKLNEPAISGKIGKDNEVTVLTANLLRVLEDDYGLKLDRDVYENAIVKCDSNGNMKLMDRTGTVELASSKNEGFLKEDGKRQVFYVSNKDVDIPGLHYVTFDVDGKQTKVRVQDGKTVSAIAVPEKPGYNFEGWFKDHDRFDFDTKITSDITLKAVWDKEVSAPHTVIFDVDGKRQEVLVADGEKVKAIADPTVEGKVFKGWFLDDKEFDFNTEITGDITLTAKFEDAGATTEDAGEALQKAIADAEKYKEEDYTAESWKAFKAALEAAQDVLDKEDATEDDFEAAAEALKAAQDALEKKVSTEDDAALAAAKASLAAVAAEAKAIYDADKGDYTEDSWKAFTKAYEEAISPSENATAEELKNLEVALLTAQKSLAKDGAVEEDYQTVMKNLRDALEKAKEVYESDPNKYTSASWSVFVAAYEDAEKMLDDSDATVEELTVSVNKLTTAQDVLQESEAPSEDGSKVAKENLLATVNEAKAVYDAGQGTYTAESWKVFEEAYKAANAAKEDATEAELKELQTRLEEAKAGLKQGGTNVNPDPDNTQVNPLPGTSAVLTPEEKAVKDTLGVTEEAAKEIYAAIKPYNVSVDTLAVTEAFMTAIDDDDDVKGSTFSLLQARAAKQTKNSVKLKWNEVSGADGYLVYGGKCDDSYKLLATLQGDKTTTYTHKKLKKGTYYKYLVCAYKNAGNTKVTLAASKTIHTVTKGSKYGVVKTVSVKKSNVKMKVGGSARISAKEIKAGLKSKTHRKLSYESDNTAVATVSKSGKIKAKKKGICYVYAYAQNGVFKKVKVTVK